ncbi:hypothetical protein NP233_g1089 [Leucocoprinus birnbaumii]|uniref:Endonuclease III homolog n=1 Tax=Leucocoprinus birnbaumii TaxID=56174 RepID=A0AAD5W2W5_9AGAR|nr:hypothetical protein NP233_g1089 [Leucocoprinus birnbaumii]
MSEPSNGAPQNSGRITRQSGRKTRNDAFVKPKTEYADRSLEAVRARKRQRKDTISAGDNGKTPSTKPRGYPIIEAPIYSSSDAGPENWREVYATIKTMRSQITSPADKFGCEQSKHKESDPKTKDEITDTAVTRLRMAVGGTLSVEAVIAAEESVISESINKVGFWRRKSGYIKQVACRLRDEFESDVPKTLDELVSLPGIGPKMAILILHVAWNINHGIGVDSHVHRLTNRLGWHRKPTKNAEETRSSLESWLPSELYREINLMLVGFGQVICTPANPRCNACELSEKQLCPSANHAGKRSGRTVLATESRRLVSVPRVTVEYEEGTS